ncbi:MAG: GNAT family N-acetyltransferase [Allorhizobium sp.]
MTIRPARPGDRQDILALWHQGWHEAHADLVPAGVLALRAPEHFTVWLDQCTDQFHVADNDGVVSGFVSVKGCEIVKFYVAEHARGAGLAAQLLSHGEALLRAQGVQHAVLFCLAGNLRAERFYARQGWAVLDTFEDGLWVPDGVADTFAARTHRLGKQLRNG